MAGQGEKGPGFVGLIVPFVLVILIGAGTGFAGFKFLGNPAPAAADATKAGSGAKAQQEPGDAKTDTAAAAGHGDTKGASKEELDRQAQEASLLAQEQSARRLELAETTVVPIPPIIANLDSPSTTWVRLEASLAVSKNSTAKPADLAQMVAPRFLAYLKTLKLSDFQSSSGFEFLSADLDEIARTSSDGQVKSVFLNGFVLE